MSAKKHQCERTKLQSTIWNIASQLRGTVDGWDFKQYVLGILFYRYLSENLTLYVNKNLRPTKQDNFDYTYANDTFATSKKETILKQKGFFLLPSELFCCVQARACHSIPLNQTLQNIFSNIEYSAISQNNLHFKGLFSDIDVNSTKLGENTQTRNENLKKILNGVASMQLGTFMENEIDAFGDAYEFLISMYATNAGKSGGEYFTPQEISELLVRLTLSCKSSIKNVYDPACGSGSLLLKFAKILGKENVQAGFFGQESNATSYNLCRINMLLHDIPYKKIHIAHGDTLLNPLHQNEKPFDIIVSNPPYSTKWMGSNSPSLLNDPRFTPAGVLAPQSKSDLAFVMHALSCLSDTGIAAIVCCPGLMYRTGAELQIRKYLIENNFIDCILQLPNKLFFGTNIATCIMILKKSKDNAHVLFLDVSNECKKNNNIKRLTKYNIKNIVQYYVERRNIQNISYKASLKEVRQKNYNLSISQYVKPEIISSTINILQLNKKIEKISLNNMRLRDELYQVLDKIHAFDD